MTRATDVGAGFYVGRMPSARELLAGHPANVAPLLLGGLLTSTIGGERVTVRLTEVEAYGGVGEDPGSHAHRGLTPYCATMFGEPGLCHVYFTYGMHWCANVVTGSPGQAGAVLLRAGEVIDGIDVARSRRGSSTDRDLARGPARLAAALGITGDLDGVDLLDPASSITLRMPSRAVDWLVSARTGVAGDGARTPWRFYVPDEPTVSSYRPAVARRRQSPGGRTE